MNCLVHRSEPCDSPVDWLCGECYGRMNSRFPGKIDGMRPFVFLHIVKCGGTSVEHALNIPLKLQTARSLLRSLTPEEWKGIFSFAVVRNPWDRVASLYHFHLKNEHHFRRRYEVKNFGGDKISFADWLAIVREKIPGRLGQSQIVSSHWEFNDWVRLVYRDGCYEEFRYTRNWCYESNADTLSNPKTGQIAVSYVAKLESIAKDFAVICQTLGLPADTPLPHDNVSVREKTRLTDLYEQDCVELVRKTFARDVKEFGYEFGG